MLIKNSQRLITYMAKYSCNDFYFDFLFDDLLDVRMNDGILAVAMTQTLPKSHPDQGRNKMSIFSSFPT